MKMLTPSLLVVFCVLVVGARADTPQTKEIPSNSVAEYSVKSCTIDCRAISIPAKAPQRVRTAAKAAQFEPCVYRGEKYEVTNPLYRGEKLEISHPLYRGEKYEIIYLDGDGERLPVRLVNPGFIGQLAEHDTVLTCTEDRIKESSAEALAGDVAPSKEGADNGKNKIKAE